MVVTQKCPEMGAAGGTSGWTWEGLSRLGTTGWSRLKGAKARVEDSEAQEVDAL